MNNTRKKSLKARLLRAFLITSIIPVVLVNLFLYFNTSNIVRDNVTELTRANLQQTRSSLNVWLESYEDILFQIYTDDDIVELIDKINRGEELAVSKKQLRRTLHGLFYTKEYIKCITVITENGTLVFYDLLTGSSTRDSALETMEMSGEELYEMISGDNQTHVIATQPAILFGADQHYLFHLGHRIIDYLDVDKQLGIVLVSVDEDLLAGVCNGDTEEKGLQEQEGVSSYSFIVNREGRLVSYPDKDRITEQVIRWNEEEEKRLEAYEKFVNELAPLGEDHVTVDFVHDERFGWDIVNVSSQEEIIQRLNTQQKIMITVLGISLGALAVMIYVLTQRLTGSLKNMAGVMKRAGKGELSARVEMENSMPAEVETIAQEFNHMMERLSVSMENEREAGARQRQAEIAALEAQINPHFLYNTLDTINWMAIDRDEYEISSSINSLAYILRYGINNSNGVVTVREEYEWLKKYLFLQQTRLKNTFQCEMHIEPELMEYPIHKLLLQPFVENAILHGFEGVNRQHFLSVSITKHGDGGDRDGEQFPCELHITIYDNGRGMSQELVDQMNQGIFPKSGQKNHIGMENAISRIQMYYGAAGKVRIESLQNQWTKILVVIPAQSSEGPEHGFVDGGRREEGAEE